jgi:hypothetical protein
VDQRTDESQALSAAARGCPALRNAHLIANWVGAGRPVTANGVLRKADVPVVGQAVGIAVPARTRSAGDVVDLHWPWTAAMTVGLLEIQNRRAVPGPALAGWDSTDGEGTLAAWSRALAAALAGTFDDEGDGSESLEIGRLALGVLAAEPAPAEPAKAIPDAVLGVGYHLYRTFDRGFGYREPAEVLLNLLAAFGAVTGLYDRSRITPLGRWALAEIGVRGQSLLPRSGVEPEPEDILQLKITLQHVRPACWRRVLVPASDTLFHLHQIIQTAFHWDGDHLHAFTVGKRQYGDSTFGAEYDEVEITLATAFTQTRKPISYVYDFGDRWAHEIVMEQAHDPDPAATYPICIDGQGDAPVEDTGGEPRWTTFDKAAINARLSTIRDPDQEYLLYVPFPQVKE